MKIRGTLAGVPVNLDPSEGVLKDEEGHPIGSFKYDGVVGPNDTIAIEMTVDNPEMVRMLTGSSIGSFSFSIPTYEKEKEA